MFMNFEFAINSDFIFATFVIAEDGTEEVFTFQENENRPSFDDENYYLNFEELSLSELDRWKEEEIYEEYSSWNINSQTKELNDFIAELSELNLNSNEIKELTEYISIFHENDCKMHWEVNQIISDKYLWDSFPTIRSLNTHKSSHSVKGIDPKYYSIVCNILGVGRSGSNYLIDSENY